MDYRTEAHTILTSISYNILPNWSISSDLAYTMGRGDITNFDDFNSHRYDDAKLDLDVSSVNPNMPYLYDAAYTNQMDSYSDLDYEQLDFNLSTSYIMDNGIGLHFNYTLFYFDDQDPYVYGDQGNTVHVLSGFLSYRF